MPNIFDLADKEAPEWAALESPSGRKIECRLILKVNRNGELERAYRWRIDGKPASKERAMIALHSHRR